MRYISLIILIACLSCQSKDKIPKDLIGKWKIYQTQLNRKDITKSADPTNQNGLEFHANENYRSFGNPGHQDEGTYTVEEHVLTFESQETKSRTGAKMILIEDTLHLEILMDSSKTLSMSLYKMK